MKLKGFKGGFSLKVRSLGCGLLAQGGSAQVGTGRKGMPTLAASYTSTPFPLCSRRPCCFSPSRRTPAPSCALLLFRLDNCCCKFCMNMWWFNCRRGSEGEEERRRGEGREGGRKERSLAGISRSSSWDDSNTSFLFSNRKKSFSISVFFCFCCTVVFSCRSDE